jgi:hypothetical protein
MKRIKLFVILALCLVSFNLGAFVNSHVAVVLEPPVCKAEGAFTTCYLPNGAISFLW